ncbi:MAG: HRDC domain-containing protein [Verrucomicrobia bacterium]|nr:HRDC domain-containing protein [Verrucomicrobiota bacterium]
MTMIKPHPLIITNSELLNDWCGTLEKCDPVAVDTEGDSLHCYFEKLCLIQIGLPEQDVLIDPLESLDFTRFNAILAQRRIILHGCDFDLRMLRRGAKFVPGQVFDTYLAARLVGLKEVGLASLVKEFFGIKLPKSSQKANWARRPLTSAMIEYATNDTLYLIELAERLSDELRAKGRWEWFEESCQKAILTAGEDREKDPERIWKIPGSAALRGRELALLRALWHWRDAEAQKADRPSFQILRNEELIELVRSVDAGRTNLPAGVHGTRRKRLAALLEEVLLLPEAEWPQRVRLVRDRPTSEEEQRMEQLKNRRDRVAEGLELDPGVIAPRQALERISREPETVSSVLMRWQQRLLGL